MEQRKDKTEFTGQIVFVIQRGELEIKALLLAYSLRRYLGGGPRLVAACPDYADWGDLAPGVRDVLTALDVEFLSVESPFAPEYPNANKMPAFAYLEEGQRAIFLDSDMLCLESWDMNELLPESMAQDISLAAKPADKLTWGTDAQWQSVNEHLGLSDTHERVRMTVFGDLNRPYLNAGLIATWHPRQLTKQWLEYSRQIRALPPGAHDPIYPWLDQIALALCAQHQIKQRVILDESWNFPATLRTLPRQGVKLCHYHKAGVVLREPALLALVREAAGKHKVIGKLLREHPKWQPIMRARLPQWRPKHLHQRDFIITGIPRSGTSMASVLLGQQKNWLVLNEPEEIIPNLRERPDGSGIGGFHRDIREQLLYGKPIENKVRDGKMVTDTALYNEREFYHPQVRGRYHRLGSKAALAYLSALNGLRQLGWPIVALIRHPLDTLASWQRTFNHLQEAQPWQLPVKPDFSGWAGWQRRALEEIAAQPDVLMRRVLLWQMLAQTLLGAEGLHLWRYEQLVQQPREHVRGLRRSMGDYGRVQSLDSLARRPREPEENPHRQLVADLCGAELRALGYFL